MKKIEIIVNSKLEEAISREIMQGVYGVLSDCEYEGISIHAETVQDNMRDGQEMAKKFRIPEFQVPEFMRHRNYPAAATERG